MRNTQPLPALFICLLMLCRLSQAVTLTDAVSGLACHIDEDTLATDIKLTGGTSFVVSSALASVGILHLSQNQSSANWQRGDMQINATLENEVCVLRFSRQSAGTLNWPVTPSGASALILPLFEGSYIPALNPVWRQTLQQQYQGIDTTADLSLPALGFDYGEFVVSLVYANPFNNQLRFTADKRGIGLDNQHHFTRLEPARPYEVRISVDKQDLLAPAKRYRQWRQQQGQLISLQHKLAAADDGMRLIGASHVYWWGERLLTPHDVIDWRLLLSLVPQQWLAAPAQQDLFNPAKIGVNSYAQKVLIQTINQYLTPDGSALSQAEIAQQRQWLQQTLGKALTAPARWGDFSPAVIQQLQQAELSRLWLGLPQWTAGSANPETIAAARNAGYLVGPYDSYDTALPEGNNNPSWLSAQLGQQAFETCGVMLENGQRKRGFQQQGVYTNPLCVRPIMKKRVSQLQHQLQFNSWFLDVDASGMLFDDFEPSRLTSQASDAQNRIDTMAWISDNLGIIVGSENGHGVVNQPVAFAHGMQLQGFGWHDNDLRRNQSSRYFLGNWYPDYQPALFFKPAALKADYQTLYFDPATRLPLFQAAFHDSVVTTNHWTLDNLKFPDRVQTMDLLQQLYNIPPLVNLSLDTLPERLSYLQHIDGFFRPLHQRLYNQALVNFTFLSQDRLVQQTRFADGTLLIANFSQQTFHWQDTDIQPLTLLATIPGQGSLRFISRSK